MALILTDLIDPATVRALIKSNLDQGTLSDATIGLSVYTSAAISELLALDPQATERDGSPEARQSIANALNRLLAAVLAPTIEQVTRETIGEESVTVQPIDLAARAAQLRREAAMEVKAAMLADDPAAVVAPVALPPFAFFGLARADRFR